MIRARPFFLARLDAGAALITTGTEAVIAMPVLGSFSRWRCPLLYYDPSRDGCLVLCRPPKIGALEDGTTVTLPFFRKGTSFFSFSSPGVSFKLVATRSSVYFLYNEDEVFRALATAIIFLIVAKSGFGGLVLTKSFVMKPNICSSLMSPEYEKPLQKAYLRKT